MRVIAPVLFLFLSAAGAQQYNCTGLNNAVFVICASQSQCCGQGTMNPTCLTDPTRQRCCYYRAAAKPCLQSDQCCGEYGPGASSAAFCCANGTLCCQTQYTGGSQCCKRGQVCCPGYTSFCCESGQKCATDGSLGCV
eukprot:TRINITY_DN14632_c0_g1_i1.p1 TRINITY_DN14632_c0_g1~~TRINITY_DN14632_c0_g1_i1.p1  ORF type:complete len:138 (-),score=15.84 TRINITY_DN14632_c0_g1_i1:86-499(-)